MDARSEGRHYRIVDCDQHVIEPPDLWEKWLDEKYQSRAPRLVKDEDGGDAWQLGPHVEALGLVATQTCTAASTKRAAASS